MATKVKGDKIKEGSIRLSALNHAQLAFIPHCESVWEMNLTQSYQVFPTDEIWYEDGYIYGDPVICVSDKIIFIKCENIERNKEYQYVVNDVCTFYIKVENGDVKIKGNSDIVELLNGIVYVGIYPANLKTSSDWNAQENEHGYIKNKPFFDNINTKIEIPDVNLDETNSVSIDTKVSTGFSLVVKYPVYDDYGDIINYKILDSQLNDQASVSIPHPAGFFDLTIITSNDGEYYVLVFNGITHDTIDAISDVRYGFYDGYDYTLIKRMDDFYIPDTISRTTDVNKKQDKLVSGTNIKTINGKSVLGNGNIEVNSATPD